MSLEKTIAVDAMTAEKGVRTLVEAAKKSVENHKDLRLILVGNPEDKYLKPFLDGMDERISFEPSEEVIGPEDSLRTILKKLERSSTYITAKLVGDEDNAAQAGVSFGNTKGVGLAVLRNETLKPVEGLKKTPLAVKLPAMRDGEMAYSIFLDVGATCLDDCSPRLLLEFGILASYYAKQEGFYKQRVGLLNNGTETKKGPKMVRDADELYRQFMEKGAPFEYCGFVEGGDLFLKGQETPEIIVTDGFTGNICLKLIEGEARFLERILKTVYKSKPTHMVAGLISHCFGVFDDIKKIVGPDECSGAYFLGLEQPFIKGHGSANKRAMQSTIDTAYRSLSLKCDFEIRKALEGISSFAE